MSHLSKIKTKITDTKILKKTLTDLNIGWNEFIHDNRIEKSTLELRISNHQKSEYDATMAWDVQSYELCADSNTWQEKRLIDAIVEKIHQKYAYNVILNESGKQGFDNTKTNVLQNGSLRIVLERWKS